MGASGMLSKIKPWRVAAGVMLVLAVGVAAVYGAGAISGWSNPADSGAPAVTGQAQDGRPRGGGAGQADLSPEDGADL